MFGECLFHVSEPSNMVAKCLRKSTERRKAVLAHGFSCDHLASFLPVMWNGKALRKMEHALEQVFHFSWNGRHRGRGREGRGRGKERTEIMNWNFNLGTKNFIVTYFPKHTFYSILGAFAFFFFWNGLVMWTCFSSVDHMISDESESVLLDSVATGVRCKCRCTMYFEKK